MLKKILYIIGLVAFLTAAWFVVAEVYPKNTGRFPLYVFFFFVDIYLWFSLRKSISKWNKFTGNFAKILYWSPFAGIVLISVTSIFYDVQYRNPVFQNYFMGVIITSYAGKLLAVIFLFSADLYGITRHVLLFQQQKKQKRYIEQKNAITRSKFLKDIGLISGGILFGGMLIGMVKWVSDFKLHTHRVSIPGLANSLIGLRIVQISDLHLGSWANTEPLEEAVNIINSQDPDLVLFTGDMVNFSSKEVKRFESILKRTKAKYGIYSVMGNHDYGGYLNWEDELSKQMNLQDLYAFYERIGWRLLRNEHETITIAGEKLAVIGVENWSKYSRFPSLGDIDKAKAGTEGASIKLLLTHDPTHWEKEVRKSHRDIDITFSGHTHGFQFGLEFKGFRWSPAQYLYKQWAGLYKEPGTHQYIYVNRGTGFIGYPGRVGILPEITLLELTA